MSRPRSYADRRPYVLPAAWEELAGPSRGEVELSASLGWTGRRRYDLDIPADLRVFYERVIVEARDVDDLARLLDGERLRAVWADVYLPVGVRHLWEQRFPGLAGTHRAAAG